MGWLQLPGGAAIERSLRWPGVLGVALPEMRGERGELGFQVRQLGDLGAQFGEFGQYLVQPGRGR